MVLRSIFVLLLVSATAFGQQYTLHSVETNTDASFRGLSIPSDTVAWVSGSKGWVLRTTDAGANWNSCRVPGFDKADFRTLLALNDTTAIIANAGSPAVVLRTTDGGQSWKQVYSNTDTAAFIDGIAFWDKQHGIIYGDPINGRLLLLTTEDGGLTWKEMPENSRPVMSAGEASFAASGTAIRSFNKRKVVIATGGKVSRLLISKNRGKKWKSISTPILQGASGTGIFSLSVLRVGYWVIAGGDYTQDTLRKDNFFYTRNGGKTWHAPTTSTRGYRECLLTVNDDRWARYPSHQTIFAIGPTGIDTSHNMGKS